MLEGGAQPPRHFQHHEMPHHVGLHVDVGVDLGMADTRLGGEVNDPVDVAGAVRQLQHRRPVGDVRLDEGEARRLAQRLQPGELQHGIVVVAEIVDSDDRLSPREQGSGDMGADETGDTCNED